jgi:acyl transferase domain-containing protein/thioesterase domain-containing protein/acyl carrier protein
VPSKLREIAKGVDMDRQGWIAIVGLALRFPGANHKDEFWRNLCAGEDSIETASDEELLARGANPTDLAKPNFVRRVSRLRDPDLFDAGFFSITNREAQMADPQLRVLLEVCQEAIDDSAHVLNGTNTGVFVGAADNDFWLSSLIYNHPSRIGASLGNRVFVKKDYIATQISHKLNLTGPSFNLNTACSTSSVAIHEAITHLLMYECDFALAGGCEIDQGIGYLYEEGGIDSRDGYCRAFDSQASGTVFGSGCGVLVLRRYDDAIADRDHIYGVIAGSSINNDGRVKSGFTAPSVAGQSRVISQALSAAGISAESVSYLEAHGTGTLVGDPIEIEALTHAFRQSTKQKRFCGIGSVKTNVGHLSVAAGVAGVIKTALALTHKKLPPLLHCAEPNPAIDFANSPFRLVTSLEDWKTDGKPRIAGVSSFGVGGTNSHIILHEPPESSVSGESRPYQLLVLSAKSDEALAQMRANISDVLTGPLKNAGLADIAFTLQTGRAEMPARCALVCHAGNASVAARSHSAWIVGQGGDRESVKLALLISDDTAQLAGSLRDLYRVEPEFKSRIDACANILKDSSGIDLRTWLLSSGHDNADARGALGDPTLVQVTSFAIGHALCGLLVSWGVRPDILVGQGVGEYVVACEAGLFSTADALKLVTARSRASRSITESTASAEGASAIDVALSDYRKAFGEVEVTRPRSEFTFNIRGQQLSYGVAREASYWEQELRGKLPRANGIGRLGDLEADLLIDVSAGGALADHLKRPGLRTFALVPGADQSSGSYEILLRAIGSLWTEGVKIDWEEFWKAETRNRVALPAYPFQRKKFWVEPHRDWSSHQTIFAPVHPLLGQRWLSSEKSKVYESFVSAGDPSYLLDHKLNDIVIFPGAAYTEMALAAARLQFGDRPVRIDNIQFERALMLNREERCHIQTVVHREKDATFSFEINCRLARREGESNADGTWRSYSGGSFQPLNPTECLPERINLPDLRKRIASQDRLEFYASEAIAYGPAFRALAALWTTEQEALGRIELPPSLRGTTAPYRFHPALLDSCFQAIGAITARNPRAAAALPVGLVNFEVYSEIPESFWVHVVFGKANGGASTADGVVDNISLSMFGDSGEPIARIGSYERKALTSENVGGSPTVRDDLCYEVAWIEQGIHATAVSDTAPNLIILSDDRDLAARLVASLRPTQKSAVFDYLALEGLSGAVKKATVDLQGRTARIELVLMRVSERDVPVEDLCDVLLGVVQSAADVDAAPLSVSIVTKGSQFVVGSSGRSPAQVSGAVLWGMGTSIAKEFPDLRCLRIDLDPNATFDAAVLTRELSRQDGEDLVAYRGLTRYVARLRPLTNAGAPYPFRIGLSDFGTFDALGRRALSRKPLADEKVEIEMVAAGLNFKETLITLGMLKTAHASADTVPLGFEGAGRIVGVGLNVRNLAIGDEVVVWANGCLASHVTVHQDSVVRFDSRRISFEQAASLPTTFMTAYFALRVLARIAKGDKILIHAAAGGVGQAAIQIAHAAGAEVYATASRGKWDYLSRQGIRHIFDSREVGFCNSILKATGAVGVDIVLNSLTGEFISESFDVLARNGRFIELGKLNIWTSEQASTYRPDVRYHAFELGVGVAAGDGRSLLETLLRPSLEAIYDGSFECPPLRVFPMTEIVPAFRWLAAGRNIGKAVVRVRDGLNHGSIPAFGSDKQYLVTGGLGALGMHVARWLISRGARDITLLSRRQPDAMISREIDEWRNSGVTATVANCDVADRHELGIVLARLPRLSGIFHCAGILDDATLPNLTRSRFATVLRPKVVGVQNLHDLTSSLPLEMFVCFSSTSALLDGAGQANYAAANAYLDSFAMYRRQLNLPALSINWGGWAGAGMAADLAMRKPGVSHDLLDPKDALKALDNLLGSGHASAVVSRMQRRLQRNADGGPLYKEVALPSAQIAAETPKNVSGINGSRASVVQFLKEDVGKILGSSASELHEDDDFIDAGIDSLMLAELRNNIQNAIGKKVPASVFVANSSVASLADALLARYIDNPSSSGKAGGAAAGAEIIELNSSASGNRLFCIPGVGDNVFDFRYLSESGIESSICVLQRNSDSSPDVFDPDEVTFLAREYASAIVRKQTKEPYHLVGYSFGGWVAVEVANQLLAMGKAVGTLTLMDSFPSFRYRNVTGYQHLAHLLFFNTLLESLGVHRAQIEEFHAIAAGMDTDAALRHFRRVVGSESIPIQIDGRQVDQLITLFRRRINTSYQLRTSRLGDVPILMVKANTRSHRLADAKESFSAMYEGAYGWEKLLENEFDIVELECSHLGILKPPYIGRVAELLVERCCRASRQVGQTVLARREDFALPKLSGSR